MKTIYLAGGCFWGTQKFFDGFDGVVSTEVGYANGKTASPTYEEVCGGSDHAETVKIDFDEQKLPTAELLGYYFTVIDPLSVDKQGEDAGRQYRTGIYYADASLLPDVRAAVRREEEKLGQPLAVEVRPLEAFYPAEAYHQKYLDRHPNGYCHIPRELLALGAKRGKGKQ